MRIFGTNSRLPPEEARILSIMQDPGPGEAKAPVSIPSPLQSVGLVLAALAVLLVGYQVFSGVVGGFLLSPEDQATLADHEHSVLLHRPLWIVLGSVVPELGLGAAIWWFVARRGLPRDVVFPLVVPKPVVWAGALALALGFAPLADLAYLGVQKIDALNHAWVGSDELLARTLEDAGPLRLLGTIVGLAIVPAVVEEALFRGVITAAHAQSFVAALLAPTILFGLFHLEPAQAAGTMVLGLAFALARLFSGSLLTAIFAHAAYNSYAILWARFAPEAQTQAPSLATTTLGLAAAGCGLLLLAMGRRASDEAES